MGTMGNLEHHFYQIFHVLLRVEKVSAPITHPTTLTATFAGYFQSLLLDEVRVLLYRLHFPAFESTEQGMCFLFTKDSDSPAH